MKFSLSLAAVTVLISSALANEERMEVVKRQAPAKPTDAEILNYALTLEYLERDFYAQGLAKFSKADFKAAGYPSYLRDRFVQLGSQEATHVSFLAGALGNDAVGECQYNFGFTDVPSFLAVSRLLESVGTSAYLGAAPDISSKAYLAAAGSILTIEARHSSFLNSATGLSGFPTPFEAPLTYSQVYSLASPFIVPGTCKGSTDLPPGIKAYPKLTVKTAHPKAGREIGLHFPLMKNYDGPYYAIFINGLKTYSVLIDSKSGVLRVPPGLVDAGLTFLIVSKCEVLSDASTIAGPSPLYL